MRSPTLGELPLPQSGKTGWPWTEESQQVPETRPDGKRWPRVSIVTPSYQQGVFIEETIRSVLLQGYPDLEYIVMDGGSSDETLSILEKYSDWLSLWRSEKDRGQAHAINKGFENATGSVRGYLNSDDLLMPDALSQVGHLAANNMGGPIIIMGECEMGYSLDNIYDRWRPIPPLDFSEIVCRFGVCPQPATFWTHCDDRTSFQFNEHLIFSLDYDFWCQLIKSGYKAIKLDAVLGFYRVHPEAKGTRLPGVMWSEMAGLPLVKAEQVESFEEKLAFVNVARLRGRHYLRLKVESVRRDEGNWAALRALMRACWSDFGLTSERPTLGLARRLLFGGFNGSAAPSDKRLD